MSSGAHFWGESDGALRFVSYSIFMELFTQYMILRGFLDVLEGIQAQIDQASLPGIKQVHLDYIFFPHLVRNKS